MTIDTHSNTTVREVTARSWMGQATCRGIDTERWFDAKPPKRVRAHIRDVCSDCPVALQCLSYALVNDEGHGAWGGRTMAEIRPLQRRFAAGETLNSVLDVGLPKSDSNRSSTAA
jgi:WhiB family transcriptional regulator, redox-sensing transcriptional regulator